VKIVLRILLSRMTKPQTDYEALVMALTLAITAPTDEKAKDCSDIADSIANKLSELEIHRAKREAKKRAGI